MFKFLKRAFGFIKVVAIGSLLCLSIYLVQHAVQFEMAFVEKYDNTYEQMIREHDLNVSYGYTLRSQRGWERANERMGLAFLDERANCQKLEQELKIQVHEMYVFYRVLEHIHPGAVKEVNNYLGPPPRFFPAPGYPDVDTPDTDDFHLTPEGHHAN